MSIDTKLMRKTIKYCRNEYTYTREVVDEFEEKYIHHASTTEEAAGLAMLLSRMQCWGSASMFFCARGLDQEKFLNQESFPIARGVSEYLIRPKYEDRGFRGILSFVFSPYKTFPLKKEIKHDYFRKTLELKDRLEKLYWDVVNEEINF